MLSEAEDLQSKLEASLRGLGIPGTGSCVFERGQLFVAGNGFSDVESGRSVSPATAFRIGCCIKLFTASLIMILRNEGYFSLDDNAGELIFGSPSFPVNLRDVKVLNLLQHTHGLDVADTDAQISRHRLMQNVAPNHDQLKAELDQTRRLFEPGDHYSYSSFGYRLLGLIAERATSRSLRQLFYNKLFEPLGISPVSDAEGGDPPDDLASTYRLNEATGKVSKISYIDRYAQGICPGRGGGLALTPTDFMQLLLVHLGQSHLAIPGLPLATILEMRERIFVKNYMMEQFAGSAIAWRKINSTTFGLAGIGFNHHCIVRVVPESNVAVVLMSNAFPAWGVYKRLFPDPVFQNNLNAVTLRRQLDARGSGDDTDQVSAEGTFQNDLGQITIKKSNGRLIGSVGIRFRKSYRPVWAAPLKRISSSGYAFESLPAGISLRESFWLIDRQPSGTPAYLWDGLYIWKRASVAPNTAPDNGRAGVQEHVA